MMKQALQALEIDIKKMPLGKIKKSQILDGYKILTEIQEAIQNPTGNQAKLKDCTNKFYTLIVSVSIILALFKIV